MKGGFVRNGVLCPRIVAPFLVLAALHAAGASCGRGDGGSTVHQPAGPSHASKAPAKVSKTAPTRPQHPSGPRITDLRGVSMAELTDAERRVALDIANDQLSPCGQPISIARCVNDGTACRECPRAARYIVRLVKDGYERQEIELLAAVRYASDQRVELNAGDSPVRGPAMASITIFEWSDFECPHCAHAAPILHRIIGDMAGRARLVFKNFPLEFHTRAMVAARAALAAGRQGKFWEMHDLLFENQTTLEQPDLERFATQLGLDLARFRRDMDLPEIQQQIDNDKAEGRRLEIDGTPTLFVNGRRYLEPIEDLQTYLREELDG